MNDLEVVGEIVDEHKDRDVVGRCKLGAIQNGLEVV